MAGLFKKKEEKVSEKKESKEVSKGREVILMTTIKREKGYLYPTGTDSNGNLIVLKIRTAWNKEKKD